MYEFQNELPNLPVPDIQESSSWYLKCLQPLVSHDEYKKAQCAIEQFITNDGAKLQEKLLEYSKSISPNSWLMPYSRDIYLDMRDPLPLVGNYLFQFLKLDFFEKYTYLELVSLIAYNIGIIYHEMFNEKFQPLKMRDTPLCMKQFEGMFRGSRIPKKGKDKFQIFKDVEEVNSFGVFFKNRYYMINLINEDGSVVNIDNILNSLTQIYNNKSDALNTNFNTIAFAGSDEAYSIIEELSNNDVNKHNFDLVNKAMFNITLTDIDSNQHSINDKLFSDTTDFYPYKSWSITVYKDKICTINHEHTYVDGATSYSVAERLLNKIKEFNGTINPSSNDSLINELKFSFDDKTNKRLDEIKDNYISKTNELSSIHYVRRNIPIQKLREQRISVDSIFQFAFQYATVKAYGNFRTTHESVSASQYYEGRTSCIRSVSNESVDFIKSLNDGKSKGKILEALKKASDRHKENIKKSKAFCSFIRHMAGLKLIYHSHSKELGIPKEPEFFSDSTFSHFCEQQLSTSTIGNSWFVDIFTYAPVTKDGLGLGYVSHNDEFTTEIMHYKFDEKNAVNFKNGLNEYFDKLGDFL